MSVPTRPHPALRLERTGPVLTVTLDDAARHNAQTPSLWAALATVGETLDPASREEILGALRTYKGAVVLVSHDEGAVSALEPERVLLLPDGVEDHFGPDYLDLIALA